MRNLRLPILVLLAVVVACAGTGCDRGARPQLLNVPAPDFTIADGTNRVHLADYRGQLVLVNFWATWCGPCVQEVPGMIEFQKANPQIKILAVSVDEDEQAYKTFIERYGMKGTIITVRDPEEKAATLFKTDMWPETYAVDRNGVIRRKFVGAQDWNDPAIANFLKRL